MCDVTSQFVTNKYVHLQEFLDKENCAQLTDALKALVAKQATTKDPQCPLSEAVHGAEVFDSLLVQLLPHFETASGKRLLPTYSYARLYAPGDELKNHTDRESCEISATITLGLEVDGQVTSFYEGEIKKDDRWSTDNGHGYYNVNPETVYPVESFIAKEHDIYLLKSTQTHSVTLKDDSRIGVNRYDPINSNVRYMITARLNLPYEEVVEILRKHKLLEDATEYV